MSKVVLVFLVLVALVCAQNSSYTSQTVVNGDGVGSRSTERNQVIRDVWTGPVPNHFTVDFFGFYVTVSNINLAGTGTNVAIVQPGSQVSLNFNYAGVQGHPEYCPGCIVQWYWGMSYVTNPTNANSGSTTPIRDCYSHGTWYSPNAQGSFTNNFVAPTVPGIQYFQWGATLDYQCDNIGFSQCPNNAWAAICVAGDTDGDGIQDCFDNCPCVPNPDQASTIYPGKGDACPYIAVPPPASVTAQCPGSNLPEPTLRNDYCGASRASTGFLSVADTTTSHGSCPDSFTRTFTVTDGCDGSQERFTESDTLVSYCDNSVTSVSPSTVSLTANNLVLWGGQGAPQQYLATVTLTAAEATNDWRVQVNLPAAGESLASVWSVYSGAALDCQGSSEIGLKPAGAWAAQLTAGATVEIEYVATNNANLSAAQIAAGTVFTVYRTASS